MPHPYLLCVTDDGATYVPVAPGTVAAFVSLNGVQAGGNSLDGTFLVVESDDQEGVSLRNKTFDMIGPARFTEKDSALMIGEKAHSMLKGQASVEGTPRQGAPARGLPEMASRIERIRPPDSSRVHVLVYPLREPSAVFGPDVKIFLYEMETEALEGFLDGKPA